MYGSTSEYVRELIRRDHERSRLRDALLAGAESAPDLDVDDAFFATLRDRARQPGMSDSGRVVLRERARHDAETAVDWYREEAGEDTALRFVNALAFALGHVGRYPSSGSARYSVELGIPGLRCWQRERLPSSRLGPLVSG